MTASLHRQLSIGIVQIGDCYWLAGEGPWNAGFVGKKADQANHLNKQNNIRMIDISCCYPPASLTCAANATAASVRGH